MLARHVLIYGRVQGVGYREALRAEAGRLGIAGWVRNRADGTVEAFFQGPGEAVEALIAWARRGPPLARVTEVRASEAPAQDGLGGRFERLPSA